MNDELTGGMDRMTVRVPPKQVEEIETLVAASMYPSQSEVVRAAIRLLLKQYDVFPEMGHAEQRAYINHVPVDTADRPRTS